MRCWLRQYAARRELEELRRFVVGALPTHLANGGAADQKRLIAVLDRQIFDLVVDQ